MAGRDRGPLAASGLCAQVPVPGGHPKGPAPEACGAQECGWAARISGGQSWTPAPHLMCVDSLLSATLGSSGSSPSILHRVGSRSERGRWALVLSPTRSLTHSFAHSFAHSFRHPCTHSFTEQTASSPRQVPGPAFHVQEATETFSVMGALNSRHSYNTPRQGGWELWGDAVWGRGCRKPACEEGRADV